MNTTVAQPFPENLARQLVLDELFDLTLYQRLAKYAHGPIRGVLEQLIRIETAHLKFWQEFFGLPLNRLTLGQRVKLGVLSATVAVFGERAIHLILESIEVYGIRKYLTVWERYQGTPLGDGVKRILQDELDHEDAIIAASLERRISGEKVRTIFLGFNDGLVEILGSVSGFFAAFAYSSSVLIAALTVAVAGSISMAAGVYVSSGSEKEVDETERRRQRFLGNGGGDTSAGDRPLTLALLVGVFYFLGALVPISPVVFGASNVLASVVISFFMIGVVSFVLSFLSGMNIWRRIQINVVVIAIAVTVTSTIGYFARQWFGISL